MGKVKTRKSQIEFRPPIKPVNGSSFLVKDEVIGHDVLVHVERMSETGIFMGIYAKDGKSYGFDFYVGNQQVEEDGEMVWPIVMSGWESAA